MKIYSTFILLSLIMFFTVGVGGCEIELGDGDGNENNRSNRGEVEVKGEITGIIPPRASDSVEGIRVAIGEFSSTTGSNGGFSVEGDISGNTEIQFQDTEDQDTEDNDRILARLRLNIFPGFNLDLGEIEINNGMVENLEDILIEFTGDVTEKDCDRDTITVEIDDSDDNSVLVQIDGSTDIVRGEDDIDCEEITDGQELLIEGMCSGTDCSNVNADDIEIN